MELGSHIDRLDADGKDRLLHNETFEERFQSMALERPSWRFGPQCYTIP